FPERAQLSGGQCLEHLRVAGAAVGRLCPDAVREHRHVGQLHGALHLRVAREDLLDQRRACPRQSDDEDRVGRRGALTGGARQELAGEERSEEHTSELQSRGHLVCRLLLEKKKKKYSKKTARS